MDNQINVEKLEQSMIKRVVERRKFLKISQEKLADSIGISRFKMIRIENGDTDISLKEYLVCCIVLDLLPFDN